MKILGHCCYIGRTGYAIHSKNFFRALSKEVDLKIRNFSIDSNWQGVYSKDVHGNSVDEIDKKINNILAGSGNQRFHFNCIIGRGEHRINRDEIEIDQEVEIHCHPDSDLIQITGFPRIDREFFRIKGIEIK